MEKTKYVMLYNYESTKDKREAKDFLQIMPEAKLLKYGVMPGCVDGTAEIQKKKMSLWIPEHLFLMAWTYFNHKCLTRGEVGFESGIDYLNKHLNDHRFVKETIDESECWT